MDDEHEVEEQLSSSSTSKLYMIVCSDDGWVSIGAEQLDALLDQMPTLRFLLLGHPQMQSKTVEKVASVHGQLPLLRVPHELAVSKKSFLLLLNCFFEVEPLPRRNNDEHESQEQSSSSSSSSSPQWTDLMETIRTLGGCKSLESRLSRLGNHAYKSNPMIPEEDSQLEFDWRTLHYRSDYPLKQADQEPLLEDGWKYTTTAQITERMTSHYYRKEKE